MVRIAHPLRARAAWERHLSKTFHIGVVTAIQWAYVLNIALSMQPVRPRARLLPLNRRVTMSEFTTSRSRHFTAFRSAADEVADAEARDETPQKEARTRAKSGHIVRTYDATEPYKVVFEHEDGANTEQACATIREGEAVIRRNTPTPPKRDASRDQDATG